MKGTIDITPTWSSLMPSMIAALEKSSTIEASRKIIREELMRLANAIDNLNGKELK